MYSTYVLDYIESKSPSPSWAVPQNPAWHASTLSSVGYDENNLRSIDYVTDGQMVLGRPGKWVIWQMLYSCCHFMLLVYMYRRWQIKLKKTQSSQRHSKSGNYPLGNRGHGSAVDHELCARFEVLIFNHYFLWMVKHIEGDSDDYYWRMLMRYGN